MFFKPSLSFPLPCQQSLLQVEESGWNASSLISSKEGRKEGESAGKVTPFTPPQHSWTFESLTPRALRGTLTFKNLFMFSVCIYSYGCICGKFGEHEKRRKNSLRCSREQLEFWVLSKLPKCMHNSIYAQLKAWANSFITERQQGSAWRSLSLW